MVSIEIHELVLLANSSFLLFSWWLFKNLTTNTRSNSWKKCTFSLSLKWRS